MNKRLITLIILSFLFGSCKPTRKAFCKYGKTITNKIALGIVAVEELKCPDPKLIEKDLNKILVKAKICDEEKLTLGADDIICPILVDVAGNVAIYEGANQITGTISYVATVGHLAFMSASRQVIVNITSTKTYKLQTRCTTGTGNLRIAGTSTTGGLSNPDNNSTIWALRIA